MNTKRTTCVACGSPLYDDIVHIGEQYPSAIYLAQGEAVPAGLESSSLNVTRCTNEACGLIQLSHAYDLQYVFDHYPYQSGSTATMGRILKDIVDEVQEIIEFDSSDVVLDIGGNDGTLLSLIREPVRARVNIDAASGVEQVLDEPDYLHVHGRFSAELYRSLELPAPKLVTSVAMFYHLSEPRQFVRDVASVMDDRSVWVLQMTYVGTMLRDNIFDNIVHEHVAYYSLKSVEYLLASEGLSVVDAKLVDSYGGSLRLYIMKDARHFPTARYRKNYPQIVAFEEQYGTNDSRELYAFNSRTQLLKEVLRSQVDHLVDRYGPLWGFGASTKGNMILQFLGLGTTSIAKILDNSTSKIGTVTAGSLVPIVDESEYLSKLSDYVLVLPYYYIDAFAKIIQRALGKGRTVHLLKPLPFPTFLSITGES